MAVFQDVDYRIGPPDGDVLSAGARKWMPVRAPYRPDMTCEQMLAFTVAGRGVYECDGTPLIVRRGDMVIMSGDSPTTHAVPAGEPWEFLYVLIDPPRQWTPPPVFEPVGPGLSTTHVALEASRQQVHDALARLIDGCRRRDTAQAIGGLAYPTGQASSRATQEARRRLMLTILDEVFLVALQDRYDRAEVDPRIAVVLGAIGADPAFPHTVESLAAMANLSPSRFAHLFTLQVGTSPMRTLRLIRLQHAARLLQYTNDPIGAVAAASGFSSIFEFSRQFRRQHAVSPRQYRTNWRA